MTAPHRTEASSTGATTCDESHRHEEEGRHDHQLNHGDSQIRGVDRTPGTAPATEGSSASTFFPFNTRNVNVNAQLIDIDGSPVNSVFGYYVGGQQGQTFSMDFSVLF
jgi:hypothetical protein